MTSALAIVIGILAGGLAAVPLFAGLRLTRNMGAQASAAGYLTPVLLALGGSFVVLVFATAICVIAARPVIVPFVLAEAGALIVIAFVFGIMKALRK